MKDRFDEHFSSAEMGALVWLFCVAFNALRLLAFRYPHSLSSYDFMENSIARFS